MPTLVLSQRYSLDSEAMWRAALHAGWDVERIRGFAVDPGLAGRARRRRAACYKAREARGCAPQGQRRGGSACRTGRSAMER